jgi:hypothetical protein
MKIKKEAPNDPLWEKLSICTPGFGQLAASEIAIKSIEPLSVISNWNEFSLHNIFHSECLHEISQGQPCCHLVLYKGKAIHMMLIYMIFPCSLLLQAVSRNLTTPLGLDCTLE